MYIDKFPDNETPHNEIVGKIQIGKKVSDLVFSTSINHEQNYRVASLLIRSSNGKESGFRKRTYNLTEGELETMLRNVGFRGIQRLQLPSEKNFVVWLAQK